jgi:hypothetical protein
MCGRCFMTIATRPHGDGVQRIGPAAGATEEEE